jgi:ligand-binding sensor domain-containing protein/signal transduction histidine kinase
VQAISQTTDGYLWIGTAGGLIRFDGLNFVVFDRSNTRAFADDSVLSLLSSTNGDLWIGTEGGGLIRYSHKVFTRYSTQQGLTNQFVRAIYQDRSGKLWVGTDRGVFQRQGEQFVRLDGTPQMPTVSAAEIGEDSDGRLWIFGNGIYGVEDGVLVKQDSGLTRGVTAIQEQADRSIWLATANGLMEMKDGRLKPIASPAAEPLRLLRDDSGNTWVGAGNGLFLARGGRIVPFEDSEPMPSTSVLALYQDHENNIWVGTGDGLVRLHKAAVTTLSGKNGIAGDAVSAIAKDRRGRIWAISGDGKLYRIGGGKVVKQSVDGLPPDARIRTLFEDRNGCYWIGTSNLGFFRWRCGPLQTYNVASGLRHNGVRAFLEDRNGSLWVATGSGLARVQNGKLRVYYTGDGLAYGSVRSLLEAQDGEIWIGTDGGLSRIRNGQFIQDAAIARLASERIWALYQDADGAIWIGTQSAGLFRYRYGRMDGFASKAGMPKAIHDILEDRAGNMWISGPAGVLEVQRKDLEWALESRAEEIPMIWYGTAEGMRSVEMSGGAQPAGAIAANGDIWFPSAQGAVAIPANAVSSSQPPTALVDKVLVDGQPVPFSQRIRIPPGTHTLEIQYTAPNLISPKRIAFSYKLDGFDKNWTETSSRRAAFYTELPAGDYRFRVIAQHRALPNHPSEAVVYFRWEPHFYQTRWFFGGLAASFASVVWCGFWMYARQTRMRYALLLTERTRLAREMHDTVIQGCVGVSTLLEAASSFERTDPSMLLDMVNRARREVRATLEDARQAVWDLRHGTAHGQRLASLPEFARQLSRDTGVPIDIEISGEVIALEDGMDRNLFAAAREALRNAITHGQPKHARLLLCYEPEQIRLEVIDDGVGFEPGEVRLAGGHYGLLGMRERMEQMGGSLRLISHHRQGTRVVAELPIRRNRTVSIS